MRCSVLSDQACMAAEEHHRQVLQCHIMNHLVIATLQESRINRKIWANAACSQPSSQRDRVLFRNAHVEEAFGIGFGKFTRSRAIPHRCGDYSHTIVLRAQTAKRLTDHTARMNLRSRTSPFHFIGGNAMEGVRFFLCRAIAMPLLRDGMHQHRAF